MDDDKGSFTDLLPQLSRHSPSVIFLLPFCILPFGSRILTVSLSPASFKGKDSIHSLCISAFRPVPSLPCRVSSVKCLPASFKDQVSRINPVLTSAFWSLGSVFPHPHVGRAGQILPSGGFCCGNECAAFSQPIDDKWFGYAGVAWHTRCVLLHRIIVCNSNGSL